MVPSDDSTSLFLGRADNPDMDYSFWRHSVGVYRELLAMLEFRLMARQTQPYTCNVERNPVATPITTLVFKLKRRRQP
jgi:hypothetical protein